MKSVKFWKMEISQLSLSERMFFRDAIRTLQAWPSLNEEYRELDLISRILERDIHITAFPQEKEQTARKNSYCKR